VREALSRVADRTLDYDYSVWFWGDAIALDGLLDAAELLDRDHLAAAVQKHVDRWVQRVRAGISWPDHMTAGAAAVRVARRFDYEAPIEAVRGLADFMADAPRSRWLDVPLRRPDLPLHRNFVLVDSLYHEGTLFYRVAETTHDEAYLDAGSHVLESMVAVLLEGSATGFFPQAVDTASRRVLGAGWGRGSGWALLGLVDALEILPRSRPEHERLANVIRDVGARLVRIQDITGFWRTILQNREAYLETSTAAFFAAVFYKGARLGLLDPELFVPAADRALAALLGRVDDTGGVFGVSALSWPDDEEAYLRKPTEVNEWGQGAALRALSEQLRFADVG
jgi:unsaturated rhamnogalacturonyl hydrolase